MSNKYLRLGAPLWGFVSRAVRVGVLPVMSGLIVISGHAAVYSWSGTSATTANWSDSANWGFAGTPTSGDTVIFAAAQPRQVNTNDIAGLSLVQVRFVGPGGGYTISGNAFTLTDSIQATNTSGANIIDNNITLATQDIVVNVATNSTLTMNGGFSGSVGMIKESPGTLILAGGTSDTYGGLTTVTAGLIELMKSSFPPATSIPGSLVIGDGTNQATVENIYGTEIADSANVTINFLGTWNLNGQIETVGTNLTLNNGSTVQVGTGALTLTPPETINCTGSANISGTGAMSLAAGPCVINVTSGTVTVSASIEGGAAITKLGQGTLRFSGANTYTGSTTVSGGFLWALNNQALGATNGGTVVSNGATLVVSGGVVITNESLTLNGVGDGFDWGALDAEAGGSGTNVWAGPITVNVDSTIMPYESEVVLRVIGPISGSGGVIVGSGGSDGTLTYEGSSANTYAGTTTVSSGTLELGQTDFDGAVPGPLVIGNDVDAVNSDVVRLLNYNQVGNNSTVTINGSGLLDEGAFYDGYGGFDGVGNINDPLALYIYGNGSYEFDGVVSGAGAVIFEGTPNSTNVWTGANTYTGITYVYGGTVIINGNQPASAVQVLDGITLGGTGTFGNLLCNGILAPGPSASPGPGILNCSNLTFSSTTSFLVDLTGPNPGAGGYDQVNDTGANALGNAALQIFPAFTTPVALGQQFIIINNNKAAAVSGTFNGLPEGATITSNNYKFTISYVGNGVGDVTLTATAIPGAPGSASVSSGNGNHAIDPNDCNNLSLSVSNQTGTVMTGVTATLSTTTEQVIISQPYSDYPNIPANGTASNNAPFEISTLSNFFCGTPISLQLAVNTSLGSFTVPFTLQSGELGAPLEYDVTGNVAIPDIGTVESTNVVSGFTSPIDKVVVALYITHQFDSDLTNISLISPDGTTVLLSSSNGGGGQNYGDNCSPEVDRTTFDDAGATSITAGTAPFVGTYRPQQPLSAYTGNVSPNGNWRLHISDGFGGSLGTLRCWSLFLYPIACSTGSGSCDLCLGSISGSVTASSAVQTNRWFREGEVSSCGQPKAWDGFGDTGTNFHYNLYAFTNSTGADACVTVELQSTNALMAGAYLNSYNPTNIAANFLGDAGNSTDADGGTTSFSSTVPAGNVLLVEVNEVTQNSGTQPYTLLVSGLPCPPPSLTITPAATNHVVLAWPTSAGGYNLEASPGLTPTSWTTVTNEPIVTSNNFTVTNTAPLPGRYYRLDKP